MYRESDRNKEKVVINLDAAIKKRTVGRCLKKMWEKDFNELIMYYMRNTIYSTRFYFHFHTFWLVRMLHGAYS